MNLPEIEKYLNLFYQISGMEIAILDKKYTQLWARQCNQPHFCHLIHRFPKCTKLCCESDQENLRRATTTKKTIGYVCPFGFYSAIAPIFREEEIVAYLLCGPAQGDRPEADRESLQKLQELVPGIDSQQIEMGLSTLQHTSVKKFQAYQALLQLLAKQIEVQELMSDTTETIASLTKRYIDNNLGEKITLSNLSWKLHSSTVTLTEHFKRTYGMSIMTYVTQKRMRLAQKMLKTDDRPISLVAHSCGFADVEYFSRTFKQQVGVSPSQWRKENFIGAKKRET